MDAPSRRTLSPEDQNRIDAVVKELGETSFLLGGKQVTAKQVFEAGVKTFTKDTSTATPRVLRLIGMRIATVLRPVTTVIDTGLQPEEVSYIQTLRKHGMSRAEVAKTMQLSEQVVASVEKPKGFAWSKWIRRGTRKRALDL